MPEQNHVPRIEYLRVQNYRALQNLELKKIAPLTVFLGPNGSGKSTIFDVFAFLSECFSVGLRKAWDRRGRFRELRTRDAEGPIEIELKYREKPSSPLITYHLAIDEGLHGAYVASEWLQWRRGQRGKPFRFLDFQSGAGRVVSGDMPDEQDQRIDEQLDSPEMLAVNTLGQFTRHPRVSALRRFITGWYLSYLTADQMRAVPEAGPQERLSATGDNLPNVIQYLKERHPGRLEEILATLSQRVPRLEKVESSFWPTAGCCCKSKMRLSSDRSWRSSPPTAHSRCWPTCPCSTIRIRPNSSASRSRKTNCIPACCLNWRRSAGQHRRARN